MELLTCFNISQLILEYKELHEWVGNIKTHHSVTQYIVFVILPNSFVLAKFEEGVLVGIVSWSVTMVTHVWEMLLPT